MSKPNDSVPHTSDQGSDLWQPCPAGTLTRAVRGIQARQRNRRRAQVVGMASGAMVVVVVVAAAMMAQPWGQAPAKVRNMGSITCAKVKSLLPEYLAGRLGAAVMGQVESHLEDCPHCRQKYDKAKDDTALPNQTLSGAPQLALRL